MRKTYILILVIIGLIALSLYSTYAMFSKDLDIGNLVNLTMSSLPTDSSIQEYERITIEAGDIKTIDLNITNSTSDSLYYGVWYEMVDPASINNNITIAKLDESENPIIGQLTSNETKKVTLYLENSTSEDIIVNIGVGYSNTNSLNLSTGKTIITAEASEAIDGDSLPQPEPIDFDYKAAVQSYTVPNTGSYKLEVWGAQGGSYNTTYVGGKGGYSYGTVLLSEGTKLFIYTGGTPTAYNTSATSGNTNAGGFNGGGAGRTYAYSGTTTYAMGGGGASDIRIGTDTLYYRVIVAGGGSGGTNGTNGYAGGGTNGVGYSSSYYGTQTAAGTGGSFGQGGASSGSYNYKYGSSGGGGGWYGGGAGTGQSDSSTAYRQYNGGGSGWVWTSSTASNKPSSYALSSSYYMTDAATVAGNDTSGNYKEPDGTTFAGHSGNGHARITYSVSYPTLTGLDDLTLSPGANYDLTSDVTCVNNGTGCTLVKVSITDTSTLAKGHYTIKYIVKDNNNVKYQYTRELYIANTASAEIISLAGSCTSWSSGFSGVCKTNDHEYRYIGANVNNWVRFNNDMYRIIGVFDDNSHGQTGQYLVKLIAADTLTAASWGATNTASAYTTYSTYNNNWETANANILLNEYFLNATDTSSTYKSCSDWTYFYSNNNYKTKDCSKIIGYGIQTTNLRNYIQPVTWYLKGYNSNGYSKQNFYTCERSDSTTISNCTSGYSGAYATKVTNKSIGLMYVSDYMYASGYYASTDTTTGSAYYYVQQNWLYNGYEWTITPQGSASDYAFRVSNGYVYSSYTNYPLALRPTFYLKSTIKIKSGEGTFTNPFVIG